MEEKVIPVEVPHDDFTEKVKMTEAGVLKVKDKSNEGGVKSLDDLSDSESLFDSSTLSIVP